MIWILLWRVWWNNQTTREGLGVRPGKKCHSVRKVASKFTESFKKLNLRRIYSQPTHFFRYKFMIKAWEKVRVKQPVHDALKKFYWLMSQKKMPIDTSRLLLIFRNIFCVFKRRTFKIALFRVSLGLFLIQGAGQSFQAGKTTQFIRNTLESAVKATNKGTLTHFLMTQCQLEAYMFSFHGGFVWKRNPFSARALNFTLIEPKYWAQQMIRNLPFLPVCPLCGGSSCATLSKVNNFFKFVLCGHILRVSEQNPLAINYAYVLRIVLQATGKSAKVGTQTVVSLLQAGVLIGYWFNLIRCSVKYEWYGGHALYQASSVLLTCAKRSNCFHCFYWSIERNWHWVNCYFQITNQTSNESERRTNQRRARYKWRICRKAASDKTASKELMYISLIALSIVEYSAYYTSVHTTNLCSLEAG